MAARNETPGLNSAPGNRNGSSSPALRSRSRVACQSCNRRKVRCDVTQTGVPCSNCQHEGGGCEVLPRKKHRPRRTRGSLSAVQAVSSTVQGDGELSDPTTRFITPTVRIERSLRVGEGSVQEYDVTPLSLGLQISTTGPKAVSSRSNEGAITSGHNAPTDGGLEGDAIMPDDSSFSYIGDKRGPRQSVYDLCHPGTPQEAQPYMPPRASNISHKPHEVEYMRTHGAFTELPTEVFNELIRCYFQHVHFFLPIVDAPGFLNEYINNGTQNISRLLLWSMLLAAANFADAGLLQRVGFSSRKAMKTAMYERAKCLYDLDKGTDKLILIQSVILLGFWYTDPQDHTGAWYWIGIAISLSQSIGLHRLPRMTSRTLQPSQARQALMRRIWWTCLVRDGWVSLAKGRPMRIHSEDCDAPMPVPRDILGELEAVCTPARELFIPADSGVLASMWIRLVKISDTLGSILRVHYRASGPDPSFEDLDKYALELQGCAQESNISYDMSDALCIHAYQLNLFHQAAVAILYRPYILNASASLPAGANTVWQKNATRRAREAASGTNNLLERLIELHAVEYLKPMIITALIPAMQIHLFDCKSSNPLICGLGKNKLQLCMLVLSNLRETYWSAGVMYRLFERAQAILNANTLSTTNKISPGPTRATSKSSGQYFTNGYLQRSHQQRNQDGDISVLLDPEPNLPSVEDTAPLWFNTSPQFSSVDELLSPGFSLSENIFQDFFPGYGSGVAYDPIVTMQNETPDDALYQI